MTKLRDNTKLEKLEKRVRPEEKMTIDVHMYEEREGKYYDVKTGELIPDDPDKKHIIVDFLSVQKRRGENYYE